MRNQRFVKTRPWVEELEPRVVLSTLPSIAPPLFESVAAASTNWAGYAVETNLNSPQTDAFTAVTGAWTVPSVIGGGTSFSSIWVGLDGFSSNTVEQVGTDSDLVNGVPNYYAWFEMYPSYAVTVTTLNISPGDKIAASVNYTGSNLFTLNLADANTGKSFLTTQTLKNAQRSSAEWIVEAPSSGRATLPLADFGAANFTSASASATLKGTTGTTTGPIDSSSWQNASINMVSGGSTEVTTSPLTDAAGTSSFTATFTGGATVTPPPRQHHRQQQDNISGQFPMVIPVGQILPSVNFDPAVLPIDTLAPPNGYAPTPLQNSAGLAAFLRGTANGYGSSGVEDPMRNDADVPPDLVPPIRRPQAPPLPGVHDNREVQPAPTVPMGESDHRENTPPPVLERRDVSRPDTPAERRNLTTGGFAKAMAGLFAAIGAVTLFNEWKATRTDDRDLFRFDLPESK